jgi:CheY-like chemotaxis protein
MITVSPSTAELDTTALLAALTALKKGDLSVRLPVTWVGVAGDAFNDVTETSFQADRTLERSRGGLGIGLTLVRLHGGRVEGRSAGEGHGSRFAAWFPRADPPHPGEAPAAVALEPQAPTKIVIAEDNKDAREMLRMLLSLAGHEVYEVGNGPEAVEIIRTTAPDIALVDVGLPGFDGYEVARRVRATMGARSVLLAAVTGYGQPEDRELALEAGFDLHVVKPIDLDDVRAIITAAERRRREDVGSRSA